MREVLARLGPVLADAGIAKVGHDLKFMTIALGRAGVELGGAVLDTMVASYLVDATRSSHDSKASRSSARTIAPLATKR